MISLMKAALDTWGVVLYLIIGLLADALDWHMALGAVGVMAIVIALAFLPVQAGPSAPRNRS